MTKEEKIKEAWGIYSYLGSVIDENGWVSTKYLPEKQCVEFNNNTDLEYDIELGYRPKTLQGIEDNNGWISLSGEPNEIEWVENLELYNIKTKEHYFCTDEHEFIEIGRFTHYKPIVKSKPPLY